MIGSLIKRKRNPRKKNSLQSFSQAGCVDYAKMQLAQSHAAPSNINLSVSTVEEDDSESEKVVKEEVEIKPNLLVANDN